MAGPLKSDVVHGPPPPPHEGSGWGGGDGPTEGPGASRRASLLMLYLGLVSSSMLFLAFAAAFLMWRSSVENWTSMRKPEILWANTAVLILSSIFLEIARRTLRSGNRAKFNWWWTAATGLGFLFLAGQGAAWLQLKDAGFYISRTPSTSFFYLLTATHATHVLGAMAALVYVDVKALRFMLGPAKRTAIDVSTIFWHFLDVLWILLMVLFYAAG